MARKLMKLWKAWYATLSHSPAARQRQNQRQRQKTDYFTFSTFCPLHLLKIELINHCYNHNE